MRDRLNGTTRLASVSSTGEVQNGYAYLPVISASGRYVAFVSNATNLGPFDPASPQDWFVHDFKQAAPRW